MYAVFSCIDTLNLGICREDPKWEYGEHNIVTIHGIFDSPEKALEAHNKVQKEFIEKQGEDGYGRITIKIVDMKNAEYPFKLFEVKYIE